MSALTAQLNDIDNEIESLLNRVDELTLKRNALEQLESTYDSTIELVKDTALLMTQAGLDPKSLAVDIRNLIAPRKTRKNTVNNTDNDDNDDNDDNYEIIEVEPAKKRKITIDVISEDDKKLILKLYNDFKKAGHSGIQGIAKLIFAATDYNIQLEAIASHLTELETLKPAPTLAPAPVVSVTQATKRTPATTPAPVVISTKLKTYKVDPESLKTPVATPEPTPAPSEKEKPVSTWTLDELKTFCAQYWHQAEIEAFIKGKGYNETDLTGYILIVSRIKGKLAGLSKTA